MPALAVSKRLTDYFATGLTFLRSIRAIELYSSPVNLGLSKVASVVQKSGTIATSVSVSIFCA